MKDTDFKRTDSLFSLCGLNCNLCPSFVRGGCGGCFSDSPCYLTCPLTPCSVEHGNVEYHKFRETAHLSSEGDLDLHEIIKAVYDTCPDTYIRPDHGRMVWDEVGRPGYGLYDRAMGTTYLCGLWEAIEKMSLQEE